MSIVAKKNFEAKDPYSGSWFPFTVLVLQNSDGGLEVICTDQFRNGVIFVEYEVDKELPISSIEEL